MGFKSLLEKTKAGIKERIELEMEERKADRAAMRMAKSEARLERRSQFARLAKEKERIKTDRKISAYKERKPLFSDRKVNLFGEPGKKKNQIRFI
jgi:hypothetical protein